MRLEPGPELSCSDHYTNGYNRSISKTGEGIMAGCALYLVMSFNNTRSMIPAQHQVSPLNTSIPEIPYHPSHHDFLISSCVSFVRFN